jgi:hypothetical protein
MQFTLLLSSQKANGSLVKKHLVSSGKYDDMHNPHGNYQTSAAGFALYLIENCPYRWLEFVMDTLCFTTGYYPVKKGN